MPFVCYKRVFPRTSARVGVRVAPNKPNRHDTNMKQPLSAGLVAALLLLVSGSAFAGVVDKVLVFSTPGVDRYADGSPVLDGECYALVWSPADRVVLAAPLAQGGRCPECLFQVPAEEAAPLEGGTWSVCLVDTRTAAGVPAGAANGVPRRVNRWAAVKGGVKVSDASGLLAAPAAANAPTRGADAGVRASALSSVPEGTPAPTIVDMAVEDGVAAFAVADTVSFLTYTVESSETLGDFSKDKYADKVDGNATAEITLATDAPGETRFFRITRAE